MIHIIIFSIIVLIVFGITFFKLIKENNSNYIWALVTEFVGIFIDFIFILNGKTPNFIVLIIMYLFGVIVPLIVLALERNGINLLEVLKIIKAIKYYKREHYELAKKELLINIEKYPNSYMSHKKLAELYEKMNEKEKAEYEYGKLIELKPKNKTNYIKLAKLYRENSKDNLAINLLEEFLKANPDYLDASLLLGDILYSKELFKEAILIYQEGLKHHPGEYILYYSMGMTYTRLNDFSNAMEYYKKAATINGIANVATLNMGQISLIFKEYGEAERYFMVCTNCDDERLQAEAYYYVAKIKLINNQKDLAVQYANIAIELNPEIIKNIEKDAYFTAIMGKIKLKENKTVKTNINEKEQNLIKYLNRTYSIVEKLIDPKIEKKDIQIENDREI